MGATTARLPDLDDKYTLREGTVFMTGLQALVRVALEQRLRDESAGLNTAGFISGYRGSPLGRYDLELWRAKRHLAERRIHFQPGVNEDLAATSVWGSQFVGCFPGAKVDGVFGIWYGKGPGVDRSGDPLRHGNLAGSSKAGGVIVLAGDDHTAKSSTTAHQSDYLLMGHATPILYPANVQEIYEYGLHGLAMSRHSGCWVSLKLVTDIVESAGTVCVGNDHPAVIIPEAPRDALHIRAQDTALAREARLHQLKLPAALDYARANRLNRIETLGDAPRLGIVTSGKSYADTRQALASLGWPLQGEALRILKVGMVWPLDADIVLEFAEGLDTILVIEEKRPVLEHQLKAILYDAPASARPRIVGKFAVGSEASAHRGEAVLPAVNELTPGQIAQAICRIAGRTMPPEQRGARPAAKLPPRAPHFCSGCPHGTSTRVPEGSRALAGIGCHGMATIQHPEQTTTMSHMGGEGALWVGQAPFTDEKHVFANMGDGTYYHSGLLAIRQAIAAGANITYKLLVNGFVSMTGGQRIEGQLSVPQIVQELTAEGVRHIVVVSDEPDRYSSIALPSGVPVRHRRELDRIQKELREVPGVSALIYEQMCAAERRRQRKRGQWPDPAVRSFINPAVCEGCGDCGSKSDCLSIEPLETPLGRKRRINQSSCNKDFSCIEGFCPSFVTVRGGRLKSAASLGTSAPVAPAPQIPVLAQSFGMLVTGIGGTGVVTIGAVVTMAAHLEGKAASSLDVTGLAQKYGAVMSHVRIAGSASEIFCARLADGEADLVLGSDLLVTAGDEALGKFRRGHTRAMVDAALVPTGDFTADPDWAPDARMFRDRIVEAADERVRFLDAARMAAALLGDAVFANSFLLGAAWQWGWLPLAEDSLLRAIELNGVSVAMNQQSFAWGRAYAADPAGVGKLAALANASATAPVSASPAGDTLGELVEHRARLLADYQSERYAARYRDRVGRVARAEQALGSDALAKAVARGYHKLLAHKDEYEVARLMVHPDFQTLLAEQFEGTYSLHFHLAGGPFARRRHGGEEPEKTEVGPWVVHAFGLLAKLRFLRDTWLDPFRRSPERALARSLLAEYESDIENIIAKLAPGNHAAAIELAALPERVRGYGHVRKKSVDSVRAHRAALLERLFVPA